MNLFGTIYFVESQVMRMKKPTSCTIPSGNTICGMIVYSLLRSLDSTPSFIAVLQLSCFHRNCSHWSYYHPVMELRAYLEHGLIPWHLHLHNHRNSLSITLKSAHFKSLGFQDPRLYRWMLLD